jgi:hypothetical protein
MSLQLPALQVSQIALQPLQMLAYHLISFLCMIRTSAALSAAAGAHATCQTQHWSAQRRRAYTAIVSSKHLLKRFLVVISGLVGLSALPREVPWSWRFRCALDAAQMHHKTQSMQILLYVCSNGIPEQPWMPSGSSRHHRWEGAPPNNRQTATASAFLPTDS